MRNGKQRVVDVAHDLLLAVKNAVRRSALPDASLKYAVEGGFRRSAKLSETTIYRNLLQIVVRSHSSKGRAVLGE